MPHGGKRPGAGKKRGSVHRRTLEWNALGKELLTRGNARVQQILDRADDHRFMEYYLGLLKYFKPKPKNPVDVNIHSSEILEFLKMSDAEQDRYIERLERELEIHKNYGQQPENQ